MPDVTPPRRARRWPDLCNPRSSKWLLRKRWRHKFFRPSATGQMA